MKKFVLALMAVTSIVALTTSTVLADAANWNAWTPTSDGTGDGTLTLTDGVTIGVDGNTTKTWTTASQQAILNGGGKTVSGNDTSQIINSSGSGTTLTLDNVTFSNGLANDKGGAVYSNGNVTISNATFKDNNNTVVDKGYGGALYVNGTATLSNVTFKDNTLTTTQSSYPYGKLYGGAIYATGDVTLSGTNTFSDNKSGNSNTSLKTVCLGGAIYSGGNVYLSGSNTFTNNSSSQWTEDSTGIAIYSNGNVEFSGDSSYALFDLNTNGKFDESSYMWVAKAIEATGTVSFSDNGTYIINDGFTCKDLSITDGANVTLHRGTTPAGNQISTMVDVSNSTTLSNATLTLNVGTGMSYNISLDTYLGTLNISGPTTLKLNVYGYNTKNNEVTAIRAKEITGINNLSCDVNFVNNNTFTFNENVYGVPKASSNYIYVEVKEANVVNRTDTTLKTDTLSTAYDTGESTQTLAIWGDTTETASTTLTNDTTGSTPTANVTMLSGVTGTQKTIDGTGLSSAAILQNSESGSVTSLSLTNVKFMGNAFEASNGTTTLNIEGENVAFYDGSPNSSASIMTASTININSSDIALDGNITGNTTFANNINLTVGDGDSTTTDGEKLKITGTMTVNGMTLNLDIFDTGNYDTINVTGVASFSGALTVNLNTAVYPENTTFDLISSDKSLSIDTSVISAALSSGQTGTFSLVDGKTLRFTMGPEPPKPIPEPSTWALLILGFAGLMWKLRSEKREARSEKA